MARGPQPGNRPKAVGVLALALLALVAGSSRAQEPELILSSEIDRVGLEDTFTVELKLLGAPQGATEPELGLGGSFRLVGRSKSHSISIVNGQTSVEVSYQYTLQPVREGVFDLGPASAAWTGGELRSGTVRVHVVAGSLQPARPEPRSPLFEDPWAPFGRADRQRRRERGKVTLLATIDRQEVYVGEPVRYRLELLTQMRVSNVRPRSEPQFTGVWTEPVDVPNPPQARRRDHEGEVYDAYLLREQLLFPTMPGTVQLEPTVWDVTVVIPDFLLATTDELARSTQPLAIEVLPLPDGGKPAGFTGAVGSYEVVSELDRTEAKVGDALLLRVTVTGVGNLQALSAPELPPLTEFRLYSSTAKPAGTGQRSARSRTWEYVLVARTPGDHTIPGVEYSFFEPSSKRYRVIRTKPLVVSVARGEDPSLAPGVDAAAAPAPARQSVEPVRREIAYLKLEPGALGAGREPLYRRSWLPVVLALPVALNAFGLTLLWARRREPVDPLVRRRRQALKLALARLRDTTQAIAAKKSDAAVGALIHDALFGYVADRFGENAAGLTRERLRELLEGTGAESLHTLLDRVDYLRFAPVAGGTEELHKLVRDATSRVKSLDGRLSRRGRT